MRRRSGQSRGWSRGPSGHGLLCAQAPSLASAWYAHCWPGSSHEIDLAVSGGLHCKVSSCMNGIESEQTHTLWCVIYLS